MSERSIGSAFKSHSHNGMRKRGRISRIGERWQVFVAIVRYDTSEDSNVSLIPYHIRSANNS
jgi:hypothetical protein